MKVYLVNDEEVEELLKTLTSDPRHAKNGAGGATMSREDQMIYDQAFRFYNYHVRAWLDKIKK